MFLYTDPQGSFTADVALKYDFEESNVIQPASITFDNASGAGALAFYGEALYGTGEYGGTIQRLFDSQLIGSGFVVSLVLARNRRTRPTLSTL